jgi:hypothetical protein
MLQRSSVDAVNSLLYEYFPLDFVFLRLTDLALLPLQNYLMRYFVHSIQFRVLAIHLLPRGYIHANSIAILPNFWRVKMEMISEHQLLIF